MKYSAPQDDPSIKDASEVARVLEANTENGLSSQEAARRLLESGRNELRAAPPVATWRRVVSQFQDPLIYLLLGAIGIAFDAWVIEGGLGWPVDAIVIALVVALNAILGYAQEAKAENAVAALARVTAVTSAVVRDAQVVRVPSAELVRGDLLVLGEGDAVGADARLHQATSLRVQEASLTGESEAVLKDAATLREPVALSDRLNMVLKGTSIAQGTGRAVVTATGMGHPDRIDRRNARCHRGGADTAAKGDWARRANVGHRYRHYRRCGGRNHPADVEHPQRRGRHPRLAARRGPGGGGGPGGVTGDPVSGASPWGPAHGKAQCDREKSFVG
jgi:hypothetical protein